MENQPSAPDPLADIKRQLDQIQAQLNQVFTLVQKLFAPGAEPEATSVPKALATYTASLPPNPASGKVIEGLFDGQNMVGPDGKVYTVPANYASKSKLVEGDQMKLTITADGSFIYKQIGPVERKRVTATLVREETAAGWRATCAEGRSYKVLHASVSYFKGEPGDQVALLIPISENNAWAAVENIIPKDMVWDELHAEETPTMLQRTQLLPKMQEIDDGSSAPVSASGQSSVTEIG